MMALAPLLLTTVGGAATGPTAAAPHYVPTTIPAGWYVIGAQDAIPQDGTSGFHLYSRDLGGHSPALAIGSIGCDGGCDQLEGRQRVVDSDGQPRPMALSIAGGRASSPWERSAARSTLIASRSRSIHASQGPGAIAATSPLAATHARR